MPRGRLSEPPTYWRRRRLLDQAQNNLGYTQNPPGDDDQLRLHLRSPAPWSLPVACDRSD